MLAISIFMQSVLAFDNHTFTRVEIPYTKNGCSFQGSPIDFCDERHLAEIKKAIATMKPNFNEHYILLPILERKKYFQKSIVLIDTVSGIVYPLPIDFYSGYANNKKGASNFGTIKYSLNKNTICIEGSIFVYRSEKDGVFCFYFNGTTFSGYRTTYMTND